MKKITIILNFLISIVVFGAYNIGDTCIDMAWTDNNGLSTSIYSQTAKGKAVFLFWGSVG